MKKVKVTPEQLLKEAQYAPVNAIEATDINKHGNTDLVFADNNSFTRMKFDNYRANHGILLLGNGRNNFSYIPQSQSELYFQGNVNSMKMLTVKGIPHLFIGVNDNTLQTHKLQK